MEGAPRQAGTRPTRRLTSAFRAADDRPMNIPFVEARWFTKTNGRRIDYIVIHDMEAAEKGDTAENVARFFATTPVKASAHYNVDNNSIVQSVREQDIAYHAPPNLHSIGIEHAGFARQTRDQWLDAYGKAMLALSAQLMAELLTKYDLPAQFLSAEDLKAGKRGITTHRNVSKAFGQTSHTDPGPDFPVAWYMDRVRAALDPQPEPPQEDDLPYTKEELKAIVRESVQAELDENLDEVAARVATRVLNQLVKRLAE
jgi:N-acetyl-anhydromuramyl-L-alanine amidase AmpD